MVPEGITIVLSNITTNTWNLPEAQLKIHKNKNSVTVTDPFLTKIQGNQSHWKKF